MKMKKMKMKTKSLNLALLVLGASLSLAAQPQAQIQEANTNGSVLQEAVGSSPISSSGSAQTRASIESLYQHPRLRNQIVRGPGDLPLLRRWAVTETSDGNTIMVNAGFDEAYQFYRQILQLTLGILTRLERDEQGNRYFIAQWSNPGRPSRGARIMEYGRTTAIEVTEIIALGENRVVGYQQNPRAHYVLGRNDKAILEIMNSIMERNLDSLEPRLNLVLPVDPR